MRQDEAWVRRRFSHARVARLATASAIGSPHIVPIVFALEDDRLVSAVDHKPKRTPHLRRLDNIADNPFVSVLVDEYDEDWSLLWWARADGWAHVVDSHDLAALVAKYPQYSGTAPSGPVILIEVDQWTGWSYR